jgi:hypothetical protein
MQPAVTAEMVGRPGLEPPFTAARRAQISPVPEQIASSRQSLPADRGLRGGVGTATTAPMRASVAEALAPRARSTASGVRGQARGAEPGSVSTQVLSSAPATFPSVPGEHETGAPRNTRRADRAIAPQPTPREQGDMGGGGTVMLDGRLVGHWLSEQMARQASRPPGGTTFFDPRQTPAWTPSGAL